MNGAQALIRTLVDVRRRRLLHQSRHLRDALRGRARRGARDARRARPVRGRRHRRRRRLRAAWPTGRRRRCCTSGPGLGNGLANLHNARKGHAPVVNIVGDHATYHKQYDAQLESDIETVARNVSSWIRSSARHRRRRHRRGRRGRRRARPARAGRHAHPARRHLVGRRRRGRRKPRAAPPPRRVAADTVEPVAKALRGGRTGGAAARRAARCASRACAPRPAIAARLGAKLLGETFPARLERGAGPARRRPPRVPRRVRGRCSSRACATSCSSTPRRRCRSSPIPTRRATSCPTGCEVHVLAAGRDDAVGRARGAGRRGRGAARRRQHPSRRRRPSCPPARSPPTRSRRALGALLPEGAIVSDEGQHLGPVRGRRTPPARRRHDWLCLTGGAIGQGLPVAVGAAVACPDRRVIASRPTAARSTPCSRCGRWPARGSTSPPSCSTTGSYAVLNMELGRVGADAAGPEAKAMLDLRQPDLDFVSLAQGMGVPASRVEFGRRARRRPRAQPRHAGPRAHRGDGSPDPVTYGGAADAETVRARDPEASRSQGAASATMACFGP